LPGSSGQPSFVERLRRNSRTIIGIDDMSLNSELAPESAQDDFETRRHADATMRLQRISALLIGEGSNGALYEHVLDAAIDLMSADMGCIQVFHQERGELRLLAARGFDPESAADWEWVRPDSPSSCGMALSAGCRVIVPDIETHEAFARTADLDALRRIGIRACQSTPLVARSGRLLGMISTHWRRPHRPTGRELQPLDVLARQAADLIERNEVESALRESREQFRWLASIVESSDDAIVSKNLGGIITSWNKGAERLYGYSAEEAIGKPVAILIPPEYQDEEYATFARVWRGDRIEHYETVHEHKDGRLIDVSLTVSPTRDAEGKIVGCSKIARDIGERKRTEAQLEASKARLQLALNATRLGLWQYDPVKRVVSGDTRFREIFGVAENETPIEAIIERVNPGDTERVWAAFRAALDPAQPQRSPTQFRLRLEDGKARWVETQGLAYLEGAGRERRVVSFIGTVADITERKQRRELLQRQADLLDQSHDAIFTWKIGGGIAYWSRGAEVIYGYARDEAIARSPHDLLRTRAHVSIQDIEAQIAEQSRWYGELTHTTRDGRDIVVESRIIRVSYNGETFALETNRDITDRKQHEERDHLLMREMNHRAKNMLGLVRAIARQTATRNPEDFIERFSHRIQALSANQELLVRSEWKGVETEDLVRAQLAPFADLIGSRIAVDGPKLRVKAAGAQAIGLAVHELATNAEKYGALSTDKGRVDIFWATDGDIFTMSWVERDGPPVSAPERRGFGTTVMERMAETSLGGTVDLDYAPSGLTWRLTCPAESALEPWGRSSTA
jgi:PAS domain S-box-containing protein